MQNHVIDPLYFYDAIEEFSFNYDWFPVINKELDESGRRIYKFDKRIIRGSLQSQGTRLIQSKDGNYTEKTYMFYCKSIYRINIGDFIFYKNIWLHVEEVEDFDECGVRSCKLKMIQLNNYKDLKEYIKYLNGEKIV